MIVDELEEVICVVSGWKVVVGSEILIGLRWLVDMMNMMISNSLVREDNDE